MSYLVICSVAFLASGLTFFSGFGLGTLLLPAFALFFPVELAVALTGVVHFLNGLFKLALIDRRAAWPVVLRFGVPAMGAALAGGWLLARLSDAAPLLTSSAFGTVLRVTPVKLAVGSALLVFASLELSAKFRQLSFSPRLLPVGGLLSGFFGGLSGTQGALRSAFLVRAGLSKEAFIGTSVVIAALVDISRLTVYSGAIVRESLRFNYSLLGAAVAAALLGAVLGNRYLSKITMLTVQRIVSAALLVVGVGLIAGLL
ncbi:hypothetical protein GCM10008101_28230 [Lysobacter xinjiangensis]|uniref:Probable membrane transporter protein n=1 Tax=Cognatilysobacter xinjiangensis TaxID=546892 RepID=A0ABQ3C8F7_9GAMM|nr:TSUP family transporter [Lysobacter xinjiangensis]GGZ72242.1 hypothetical protein GCM10008101_28230 [Lysobacter xinjiangensis]